MMKSNEFNTNVQKLNRRSKVERELDDFLNTCLLNDVTIGSHYERINELLKQYMAVVRSRNNVRRNWHPEKARACDLETLQWIAKDICRSSLEKRMRKALEVSSNGKQVIPEESILKIVNDHIEELYKSNRKDSKPLELENIVRRILKSNPDATDADIKNEMKSSPEKYGIVDIDETHVVIRVPKGIGKQYEDKTRSFATIKNILTRIKSPK
jgi:hypothetical protein